MSPLYWVALVVLIIYLVAVRGTRGRVRVLYSLGAGVTIVALLSSAARVIAPGSPLLLGLFVLGIAAAGYAGMVTLLARPMPKA